MEAMLLWPNYRIIVPEDNRDDNLDHLFDMWNETAEQIEELDFEEFMKFWRKLTKKLRMIEKAMIPYGAVKTKISD